MMKELIVDMALLPFTIMLRSLALSLLITFLRRFYVRNSKKGKVTVVVLGDIGRSPRMQYHSLSLSNHNFHVHLLGFAGSKPHRSITDCEKISIHHVHEADIKGLPKLMTYVVKVILQSGYLVKTLLFEAGATEYVLIQNPPCIPGMAICFFISLFNGSKFIIDWHNYGYSILSMSLGENHPLVKVAKFYEELFGQLSTENICVTHAMRSDLLLKWRVNATTMHDRPGKLFTPMNMKEKHEFFERMCKEGIREFGDRDVTTKAKSSPSLNRFTCVGDDGGIVNKPNRPAIIISSTSWTEDEDFYILIDALDMYEEQKAGDHASKLPDVLCVVTGKGPQKEDYKKILSKKSWKFIEVITPWLEAGDYPLMLACADVGISLHTSSSGLDLPMKVVDMFGSRLPVLAIKFPCLNELVIHDSNGLVFEDADEFNSQLQRVLLNYNHPEEDGGDSGKLLDSYRTNVDKFRLRTWTHEWDEHVLPCFK